METLITCIAVAFMLLFDFFSAFCTLFGRQVLKKFNAALDHVITLRFISIFRNIICFHCIITDFNCQHMFYNIVKKMKRAAECFIVKKGDEQPINSASK